jgi:Ca2+/Na+ antiporter
MYLSSVFFFKNFEVNRRTAKKKKKNYLFTLFVICFFLLLLLLAVFVFVWLFEVLAVLCLH